MQLSRARVQLRKVSSTLRLRATERSLPIRIYGRPAEAGRTRSASTGGLLQSHHERGNIGRRLRSLSSGVVRERNEDAARVPRMVQ